MGAPSDAVSPFQHRHRHSRALQRSRRNQARYPGADDDDGFDRALHRGRDRLLQIVDEHGGNLGLGSSSGDWARHDQDEIGSAGRPDLLERQEEMPPDRSRFMYQVLASTPMPAVDGHIDATYTDRGAGPRTSVRRSSR